MATHTILHFLFPLIGLVTLAFAFMALGDSQLLGVDKQPGGGVGQPVPINCYNSLDTPLVAGQAFSITVKILQQDVVPNNKVKIVVLSTPQTYAVGQGFTYSLSSKGPWTPFTTSFVLQFASATPTQAVWIKPPANYVNMLNIYAMSNMLTALPAGSNPVATSHCAVVFRQPTKAAGNQGVPLTDDYAVVGGSSGTNATSSLPRILYIVPSELFLVAGQDDFECSVRISEKLPSEQKERSLFITCDTEGQAALRPKGAQSPAWPYKLDFNKSNQATFTVETLPIEAEKSVTLSAYWDSETPDSGISVTIDLSPSSV